MVRVSFTRYGQTYTASRMGKSPDIPSSNAKLQRFTTYGRKNNKAAMGSMVMH